MGKARHAFSPWGWEFLEARVGLGASTQEAMRVLRILPLQGSGTPVGGLQAQPDPAVPATGWEGLCANVC